MNTPTSEERYRRIIERIDRLPSLPAVAARLIEVVNSPDSSADDAAELIEKDPALVRRFTPVWLEEPTINDAIKIVEHVAKTRLSEHHGGFVVVNKIERRV